MEGLTPIERLKGAGICAGSGGDMQKTFRECVDNGEEGGRDVQAENARLRVDGD